MDCDIRDIRAIGARAAGTGLQLVFAGHSMGGLVAANLAALAARGALPPPLVLISVTPGKTWPYGTWKLLDGLTDAVFRGVHREYALGNTAQQRYMGEWSDRMPVRELMIGLP